MTKVRWTRSRAEDGAMPSAGRRWRLMLFGAEQQVEAGELI